MVLLFAFAVQGCKSRDAKQINTVARMGVYTQPIPGTKQNIEMTPIPVAAAGDGKRYPATFGMGSPDPQRGRKTNEGPRFSVKLQPFWMGTYEITWDQYLAFLDEAELYEIGRVQPETETMTDLLLDAISMASGLRYDPSTLHRFMGQRGGYPVTSVSPLAARRFTQWLSVKTGRFYRLPTEAEWEYAARAGSEAAYSWGDDASKLGDYAWFYDNSEFDDPDKGHPDTGSGYRKVGTKKPNPWGLYDMYGNVSEWVIDQYVSNHYSKFAGATVDWQDAIAWPTKVYGRVARGGNWDAEAKDCRSASRLVSSSDWQRTDPRIPRCIWWYTNATHVGFRIVRPLREPTEAQKQRYWGTGSTTIKDTLDLQRQNRRRLISSNK